GEVLAEDAGRGAGRGVGVGVVLDAVAGHRDRGRRRVHEQAARDVGDRVVGETAADGGAGDDRIGAAGDGRGGDRTRARQGDTGDAVGAEQAGGAELSPVERLGLAVRLGPVVGGDRQRRRGDGGGDRPSRVLIVAGRVVERPRVGRAADRGVDGGRQVEIGA